MEGGSRFEARPAQPQEDPRIKQQDSMVRGAFTSPEAELALYEADSVLWLKGVIGLNTERGASEVSDSELVERLVSYGRYEWDPYVARRVARYLRSRGFSWSY